MQSNERINGYDIENGMFKCEPYLDIDFLVYIVLNYVINNVFCRL